MGEFERFGDADRSQSETIGVVLLTAIVVISASTIGGFYLSTLDTDSDSTLFSVQGDVSPPNVSITHTGGDTVPAGELRLVVRIDGSRVTSPVLDERFAPGNTWRVNVSEHANVSNGSIVRVTLYHLPSQSERYTDEWLVEENWTTTESPTATGTSTATETST